MNYNLYLTYEAEDLLNIQDDVTQVWDNIFASIMHETDQAMENAVDYNPARTKIGIIDVLVYNQVLAMTYGINLNDVPVISMRMDSKPIMELDYTCISQETIDEVGVTANPNILVLQHFGIAAAWRNKGIGEQVLKSFIKQMKGKYGYMIITDSTPAQLQEKPICEEFYNIHGVELTGLEKDPEKAQLKLNAFFQRCGFRLFKSYPNVFVCNIDQAVPIRGMVNAAI